MTTSLATTGERTSHECNEPAEAVAIIRQVCGIAGDSNLVLGGRSGRQQTRLRMALRRHDTAAVYDHLVKTFSFQGISDRAALAYMEKRPSVGWHSVVNGLASSSNRCPKLQTFWHFHGCRFDKQSQTCAEPGHRPTCPLPRHDLRNGRLNQMTYSLFLFCCDVADGDLVGWIDRQLIAASAAVGEESGARSRAVIEQMRAIFGVSDKLLNMALSDLMFAAPLRWLHWHSAAADMIAIDSLVHNFFDRTGILDRRGQSHALGAACYAPNRCADIIRQAAGVIDARHFNPAYPQSFPRFVQHAIWRYCSESGLDVCNGNRVVTAGACTHVTCGVRQRCAKHATSSGQASELSVA